MQRVTAGPWPLILMQACDAEDRDSQDGCRTFLVLWENHPRRGRESLGSRLYGKVTRQWFTVRQCGDCTQPHCPPGDKLVLSCLLAGSLSSQKEAVEPSGLTLKS